MHFPRLCGICGGAFARTDAVVYLRAERILMHRSCCHLHPSCHCDESRAVGPELPARDAESTEAAAA